MSIDDRIAADQPKTFKFTAENEKKIKRIIAKYPKGRQASAVMPLLDLAQRQHGNWIPMVAIEAVVNSCHDELNLLLMHTLDRKGSQKEIT